MTPLVARDRNPTWTSLTKGILLCVMGISKEAKNKMDFGVRKSQSHRLNCQQDSVLITCVCSLIHEFLILLSLWKPCLSNSLVHMAGRKQNKHNRNLHHLTYQVSALPLLLLSFSFKI